MAKHKKKRAYFVRICKYSNLPFLCKCKGKVCLKHDTSKFTNGLTECMDYKDLNEIKKKFSFYLNKPTKTKPYKYTAEHRFNNFYGIISKPKDLLLNSENDNI